MKGLVSIRMRASRRQVSGHERKDLHISGAEGLYEASEILTVAKKFIRRALLHQKGNADDIAVTIEAVDREPRRITTLPLATLRCRSLREAQEYTARLLGCLTISDKSYHIACKCLNKGTMRGASIITVKTSKRLEPDRQRGVRVSRIGIDKKAARKLGTKLSRRGINNDTVREALILASKVASCRNIVAELCVSDDPFYTTGYVASKKFGYIRIPNIKRKRSKTGGRVFFVREGTDPDSLIPYLERAPVIIADIAQCRGIFSLDEIIDYSDK